MYRLVNVSVKPAGRFGAPETETEPGPSGVMVGFMTTSVLDGAASIDLLSDPVDLAETTPGCRAKQPPDTGATQSARARRVRAERGGHLALAGCGERHTGGSAVVGIRLTRDQHGFLDPVWQPGVVPPAAAHAGFPRTVRTVMFE
jgi:hypothetical protein